MGVIHDLLVVTVVWMVSSVVPIHSVGKPKRVVGGEGLASNDIYRTYFYAQIRRSWACVVDQTEHDLKPCQEDYNRCGASLINPEFVITSAQCLMYYEVHLRYKGLHPDEWEEHKQLQENYDQDWLDELSDVFKEPWQVVAYVVVPKPKHTVYSDWTIFMGSANALKMTQKRHVVSVFPHAKFPILDKTDPSEMRDFKEIQNSFHDVSLLRACLPFNLKKGEVEVANMFRETKKLQVQYEEIVTRSSACLYVGFGVVDFQDQPQNWGYRIGGGVQAANPYEMKHTWRFSNCYSDCNADLVQPGLENHTCSLCSTHHGVFVGVPTEEDFGSPVMCNGYFVSVVTRSVSDVKHNFSSTGSYPLHCVWDSISDDRLKHYMTLPLEGYHPISRGGTKRLRRFPMPPEWLL